MRPIRFRCPRCRMHHTASAARAGQPFACSSCFAPMIIPDEAAAPSAEVPLARPIEVPAPEVEPAPPAPAAVVRKTAPAVVARPAPRPRQVPAAAKPSPWPISPTPPKPAPIEFRHEPKPEPAPIDLPPIDLGPITDGSPAPPSRPRSRVAAVLAGLVGMAAAIGLTAVLLAPREGPRQDEPAALAIVEAAPVPAPGPVPPPTAPAPEPAPKPEPVSTNPKPEPVATVPIPAPAPVATIAPPTPRIDPPAREPEPAPEPAPARPLVVRRRQLLDQDALRRQLANMPEIVISHQTENSLLAAYGLPPVPHVAHHHRASRGLVGQAGFLGPAFGGARPRIAVAPPAEDDDEPVMHVAHQKDTSLATLALLKRRQPELGHLPWRMGEECHLPRESAEELEVQSRSLRDHLSAAIPVGDTRPDAETLRAALLGPASAPAPVPVRRRLGRTQVRADVPSAIPALMQLLMAERTPARLVLVEVLSQIQGPAASKALARLATFDLDSGVRERALTALRERPAGDFRANLLEGLRYPWPPVADHAAEALVALEDREAIPGLVEMLDDPDPLQPRTEVREGRPVTFTRSLVQVNHLRNCLLCHAPSTNSTVDLVRGRVPTEGLPLPPPREYYASTSPGAFVRAEVTYLRQDFSATQPVEQPGPWPGYQRYDYLVAERLVPTTHRPLEPKSKTKPKTIPTYPQRESALFALRQLVGKDLGDDPAAWKAETRPKPPAD